MKTKILKTLELIHRASGKIALNNLEALTNRGEEKHLLGGEFVNLLKEMRKEKLITSDENGWNYSITEEGLKYLKNSNKD